MKQLYCVNRIRDYSGNVLQYILREEDGKTIIVGPGAVRTGIQNGVFTISNLSVGKNGVVRERKAKNKLNYCYVDSYVIFKMYRTMKQSSKKALLFRSFVDTQKQLAKYKLMGVSILNIENYPNFVYIETDKTVEFLSEKQIKFRNSNVKKNPCIKPEGHFTKQFYLSIDLSQVDTSEMTNMDFMFEDCKIDALNLTNFNTSNVTSMEYMFANFGKETTNLDVSMVDTSNVTNMTGMFMMLSSHQPLLNLSHFNTSKVENMYGLFAGCHAQTIDIRGFDFRRVNEKRDMFNNCQGNVLED